MLCHRVAVSTFLLKKEYCLGNIMSVCLYILEMEGYNTFGGGVPQVNNPGKQTNLKVLCPPDTPYKTIIDKNGNERKVGTWILEKEDGWKLHAKKIKKITFSIRQVQQETTPQEGQRQILFLSFRVDNARPNKDVAVWINGIRNKLSAKDHVYYNENKIFTYAVPLKDGEDTISVTFGKGKYQLSHVQAYLGSLPERSKTLYQSEVQVDKKLTKDNVIQGTIQVKNDGWFITSIPYDTHFKMYIDGKETKIQKVNTAFLGCEIGSGKHEVRIVYHAPGATEGKVFSMIGIVGFVLLLVL